jgi:gamma-glutamylcyclotransferase (GGCT)/AIG2-like uncharacterized protein YtfP
MPQSSLNQPGTFDEPSWLLLFVYGTLRRGGTNDIKQFGARARWQSSARVRGRLYDLGPYPGLILGGPDWVQGELYRIDPAIEPALDRLEQVWPDRTGEYRRSMAMVVTGDPPGVDQVCAALVYEMDAQIALRWPLIVGGDWIAHGLNRGSAR